LKLRLTETWIKRHKPQPNKHLDVFDIVQRKPALILRISWGGAKTFRVRYRDDQGKAHTHKLGRWDPAKFDLEAARTAAAKFDATSIKPKSGTQRSAPDGETDVTALSTFASVVEIYISEEVVNFRTRKETERCLRKYAVPKFGERIFGEITAFEVKQLRKTLARDNGPRQADVVFAVVRSMMMWVEDEKNDNGAYVCPLKYRTRRRKPKGSGARNGRDRVLNDKELRMVWNAASQMGQFGGMVKLLLLTAQRRQCLATARWSEFDGDTWNIRDEPGDPKGTAGILKLPPLALTILNDLPRIKGNPFVFGVTHKGDHKPFNSFSQRCKELNELLPDEISRWTLHDLRRTASTRMGDIGIDVQIGELVLGHALPGVKGTYNRSRFLAQKTDALLRLSEHIAQVVTPATPGGNVVPIASRRA
jgi:integrase